MGVQVAELISLWLGSELEEEEKKKQRRGGAMIALFKCMVTMT